MVHPGPYLVGTWLYHSDRFDCPVFIDPRTVGVFCVAGSLRQEQTGKQMQGGRSAQLREDVLLVWCR